jgi:hypothetical protein
LVGTGRRKRGVRSYRVAKLTEKLPAADRKRSKSIRLHGLLGFQLPLSLNATGSSGRLLDRWYPKRCRVLIRGNAGAVERDRCALHKREDPGMTLTTPMSR